MADSITIHNVSELEQYKRIIKQNMDKCILQLKELVKDKETFDIFKQLKFEKSVTEPITGEPENLIEVVNQSQTYLVSIMGVEYLYKIYPNQIFIINWGNVPGYDIESYDGRVICECFAATSYSSNSKLMNDLNRLSKNGKAQKKYEFFYDKDFTDKHKPYYEKKFPDIEIIKFSEIKIS